VTRLLSGIEQGDPSAAEQLLSLVDEELRQLAAQRLAHECPGQTLQAAALVHEAYLHLVGSPPGTHWNGRGHFFAAAAEAMRRILVETDRRKGRMEPGTRGRTASPARGGGAALRLDGGCPDREVSVRAGRKGKRPSVGY
jgi:RNA polymerase sigma factor (TIGR02999 family)